MFIYIFILFIILIYSLLGEKNKAIIPVISVFLILLAGLRSIGVDPDSITYKNAWDNLRAGEIVAIDPTFIILAKLVPNFGCLIFLYAIIGVSIKTIVATKLSPFPIYSMLIYYAHFFFLHEMTQIRVGVATGLLLFEIYYIVKRRKNKAIIFLLLATIFHSTALIGAIFFFINPLDNNLKKFIYIFICATILHLCHISIINILSVIPLGGLWNKVNLYINLLSEGQQASINIFNIAFIFQILVGTLFVLICQKNLGNKYTIILTKIYWLGLTIYILFTEVPVFAFRLSELCLVGEFILIPQLIYLFKPKKTAKLIVIISGVGLFSLYVLYLHSIETYQISI